MMSPPSNDQMSLSVGGSVAALRPVSLADPRNCGQAPGGAADAGPDGVTRGVWAAPTTASTPPHTTVPASPIKLAVASRRVTPSGTTSPPAQTVGSGC